MSTACSTERHRRRARACRYTFAVGSPPVTGMDAARLGIAGLLTLLLGMLILVATRKRRGENGTAVR